VFALDRTELVAAVAAGQFLFNLAGNALLVPRFGALGAALTTGTAWVLSALAYATLVLWLTRRAARQAA
jgi:O-antigen/teichoic acid export membrane protein